jgi:hypothetical protein
MCNIKQIIVLVPTKICWKDCSDDEDDDENKSTESIATTNSYKKLRSRVNTGKGCKSKKRRGKHCRK